MTDAITTPTPSMSPDQQAALAGAVGALAQAAPAIAVAAGASPQVSAAVTAAQALVPFAIELANAQQNGLLTEQQALQVLNVAKANTANLHQSLLASVALHPGV